MSRSSAPATDLSICCWAGSSATCADTDKLELRDQLPAGCEYHVAGSDPGMSVRVCEVWKSDEAHGRFMEQIGPFFEELGVPPPSKVTVVPLVRHLGTK